MADYRLIGQDHVPKDLVAKITGRARYAEDFKVEGMLFAKLLLSPMPHGRVRRLNVEPALAMEGVHAVITADDLPEVDPEDEPILTNEPRYQGQPIAAVAAEDETIAAEAVERIELQMERRPFALDPLESLKPGGPDGHPDGNVVEGDGIRRLKWTSAQVSAFSEGDRYPEDIPVSDEWEIGDVEAGFAQADLIIEEPYVYQSQTHHPLEPRSAMAYWRNGKLYLHASTQSVAQTKRRMAGELGMDEEDVVFIGEYCGGGFGSKITGSLTDLVPAFLSRETGRPVLFRPTRDEETYFGRARPGFQGWVKIGFRADGRVLAIDYLIVQDNGCYGRRGDMNMAGNVASLTYQPENMRHRVISVHTNTPPRAAQRAPGGVQCTAVLEPVMDKAARELGVDRLDMMRLNAPEGRAEFGPGGAQLTSAFVKEAVDIAEERFRWQEKKRLSGREENGKVTGVGVSFSPFVGGSSGFDGLLVIRPDGRLYVHQGIGNLGTHSVFDTALAAAEVLGVDWEDVDVVWGDTSKGLPWSSVQAGSQTTHAHSRANWAAAHDARDKLREIAANELGGSPDAYEVDGGRVFQRANPAVGFSLAEAAERAIDLGGRYAGHELPEDINEMTVHSARRLAGEGLVGVAQDQYRHEGATWSSVITCCVVELDRATGVVDVKEWLAVTDCGTVMHPRSLAAQVHGGGLQGLSSALFEKWGYDNRWGVNANKRFYTAKPVTILDIPLELEHDAVDIADPETPVGSRGIGEPPIGGGAAAVVAAINDAMGGISINRTPLTPDKILNALEGTRPGYGRLQTHV